MTLSEAPRPVEVDRTADTPGERCRRYAETTHLHEGADQIQRVVVARALLR